jgi:GNAT superfamily N-acetyltransferase
MQSSNITINIRRARQSDKRIVLDFCKRTFGRWGDYLPEVWDEWVKDRRGIFFVATLGQSRSSRRSLSRAPLGYISTPLDDRSRGAKGSVTKANTGRPVGVGKITVQRPGEIWLEGLRVDPKFRGHKIGRAIQDWSWKWALSQRPRFIRYATGSYNKISQHLGMSMGMRIIAGFDEYIAKPWPKPETALVRSNMSELEALRQLFQKDKDAAHWKGLFLQGWSAWEFDRESLTGLVRQKRVYSLYDDRGLAGALAILQSKDKKYFNYCRAAARDSSTFKSILHEGRALAHLLGAGKMEMHLPKSARNRRLVKGTGWRRPMDIWMVILEKRL